MKKSDDVIIDVCIKSTNVNTIKIIVASSMDGFSETPNNFALNLAFDTNNRNESSSSRVLL